MPMKALVTGGAGYFGEVLVRKLLEHGYQVRIFDINRLEPPLDGVEVVQADIRDRETVARACLGMDVVFHNVAHNPLAKHKHLFWSVNHGGTENLLHACFEQKIHKVVYTSSAAIYGAPKSNPVTEETPPTPMEEYGRAKLSGEDLCREYAGRGLDVSIIRPRTIMGHGRLGIFQILYEWIYQGYNIPVLNDGKNVFSFVHADDLAEGCILASRRPGAETYSLGTDRFGTMREALEHLCAYAGTGSKVRSLPMLPVTIAMKLCWWLGLSPLAPYHTLMYGKSMYYDISKAKTQLGWQPVFSNNEMFEDSYRWYLAHRDAVLNPTSKTSDHKSALKARVLSVVPWLL